MSEYSHHLEPSALGIEIRNFRVTGLPDPTVGSDAVPLRWLEDFTGTVISKGGTRVIPLSLTLGATEDFALVPLTAGASPIICQVWVPRHDVGQHWGTDVQTIFEAGQRYLRIAFSKGVVPDGVCDLVITGNQSTEPGEGGGVGAILFVTTGLVTDTNDDDTFRSVLPPRKVSGSEVLPELGTGTVIMFEAGGVMIAADNHEPEVLLKIGPSFQFLFKVKDPGTHTDGNAHVWSLRAWFNIVAGGVVTAAGAMETTEAPGVHPAGYNILTTATISGTLDTAAGNAVDLQFRGQETVPSFTCNYALCVRY